MFSQASVSIFFYFFYYTAAFNLYPSINLDKFARALGISNTCLIALNTTLPCDQTLFQMANTVDSYLWTTENVTELCTPGCVQTAHKWWSDVEDKCADDHITAYGKLLPAASIAGRFSEGMNIACLKPKASSNGSSWCLIESQEWEGSDVIRPDCTNNSTEPSCSDPTDVEPQNERIANLYQNHMLCSDCFLSMFHTRMSSPYLPDHDYSDYLIAQYQDIIDVCNATMPELTVRALPNYSDAPGIYRGTPTFASNNSDVGTSISPTYGNFSIHNPSANSSTNSSTHTTKCQGQKMSVDDLLGVNVTGCSSLSTHYQVPTGDLEAIIGNQFCAFLESTYCIPAPCHVMQVTKGSTCDSIAKSLSKHDVNVTTLQFQSWNPNLNGFCDDLQVGDYVCTSPPGGSYTAPLISNATANANTQQRGGGDGSSGGKPQDSATLGNTTSTSSNTTAPLLNSTPNAAKSPSSSTVRPPPTTLTSGSVTAPSPTQSGIAASCNKYSQVVSGDYCEKFANRNGVSPAKLYSWNPVLGAGGKDCVKQLFSGFYYCVGVGK